MQPALHSEAAEKKEHDHQESNSMLSKMMNAEQEARAVNAI